MKFILATRIGNLKTFRPTSAPAISKITKNTYESGFQEEHLKDINGGTAFHNQYMGKLADILQWPQARALISIGGPAAWIAKWYGGPSIVQHFMSGPRAQVTIHHRGAVASSPLFDDSIFYDQILAQEENLVHSFIPAENPEHHCWLFPTAEIMDDFCSHWCGEWAQGCNFICHNIARGLDCGTAKWGLYTPPHIPCGLQVESRSIPGVHVDFRHFFFGGSPANLLSRIHLESTWSSVGVQLLHLDNIDSTSGHRQLN